VIATQRWRAASTGREQIAAPIAMGRPAISGKRAQISGRNWRIDRQSPGRRDENAASGHQ